MDRVSDFTTKPRSSSKQAIIALRPILFSGYMPSMKDRCCSHSPLLYRIVSLRRGGGNIDEAGASRWSILAYLLLQLVEPLFEACGKRTKFCGDECSDENRWVLHAGVLI